MRRTPTVPAPRHRPRLRARLQARRRPLSALVPGLAATVAVTCTAATGVAGCGVGEQGEDGGELALPRAAAYFRAPCPPAGGAPAARKLTYWSMWTKDEPQGKVLQHAFACFEKRTGVKVSVEWLGRKYLTQNLAPALNTGSVPDLFDQDINQVRAAIVSAGGTQPVDDVLGMATGERGAPSGPPASGTAAPRTAGPGTASPGTARPRTAGPGTASPTAPAAAGSPRSPSAGPAGPRPSTGPGGMLTVGDVVPRAYYDFPQNRDGAGRLVQIPYEILANAWWYDRKRAAGAAPPQTMDQLFAMFDRSRRSGRAAIAQDGDINLYNAFFFSQLAARYVGPGGLVAAAQDRTGRRWRAEPGFLQAARYVERLARGRYLLDGWDAAKFPQVQQRWADGEADYLFVGSWGPSETREYLAKQGDGAGTIDYGSFQFPMPPGARYDIVERMPVGFAIPRQARHPDAAKAFIAYFLNRELLAGIPAVADNLTPRPDLPVPPDIAGVKQALDDPRKRQALFMDGIDGMFGGTYVDEVFYPADNDLLKGKIGAREFVDRMARDTAEYWKARG